MPESYSKLQCPSPRRFVRSTRLERERIRKRSVSTSLAANALWRGSVCRLGPPGFQRFQLESPHTQMPGMNRARCCLSSNSRPKRWRVQRSASAWGLSEPPTAGWCTPSTSTCRLACVKSKLASGNSFGRANGKPRIARGKSVAFPREDSRGCRASRGGLVRGDLDLPAMGLSEAPGSVGQTPIGRARRTANAPRRTARFGAGPSQKEPSLAREYGIEGGRPVLQAPSAARRASPPGPCERRVHELRAETRLQLRCCLGLERRFGYKTHGSAPARPQAD